MPINRSEHQFMSQTIIQQLNHQLKVKILNQCQKIEHSPSCQGFAGSKYSVTSWSSSGGKQTFLWPLSCFFLPISWSDRMFLSVFVSPCALGCKSSGHAVFLSGSVDISNASTLTQHLPTGPHQLTRKSHCNQQNKLVC